MRVELKMPALSPTMEKGTLARWLVSEGDMIKAGDFIAEVETDKATMEVEAVEDGLVAQIVIPEGSENIPVGTVIAVLGEASESGEGPILEKTKVGSEARAETAEAPASSMTTPAALVPAATPPIVPSAVAKAPRGLRQLPADRIKVSPLAQRIADARGIDLSGIQGTGPHGRIVRADLSLKSVNTFSAVASAPHQMPIASTIAPPPYGVPLETVRLSGMRKTIARRLTESKQTVPHFYLTARCNLDALLALRTEINGSLAPQGVKISVNDFLIKALGVALGEVPDAHVQFGGEDLHRFSRADISMAVAIDGGLVTPVIKDVGNLSLSSIARQSRALAEKARDGRLTPEDYQGGTASISNLGMFGIDEIFPVINPPQALIVGAAAGIKQPWQVDGAVGLATIMATTTSFDHRAIDGATAAQFLQAFREVIEAPLLLCS